MLPVAPRPGGEADKLGNKYEAAWVVRHALYCIFDPSASLTAEDIDPEVSYGSEFIFMIGGRSEVHQLKRQHGNSNYWSVSALASAGVFTAALAHVAAGREYHFVSQIPCGPLKELAERARKSSDLATFTQAWLTVELRAAFSELSAAGVLGSSQVAWTTLRGMWFEVQSEDDIVRVNHMLASKTLEGATGSLAALAIADIVVDNLGRRLTSVELLQLLEVHSIRLLQASTRHDVRQQVRAITGSWTDKIRRELLQPVIARTESDTLITQIEENRLTLLVGAAGGGKSSVLFQAATSLPAEDRAVLAFRLDRLKPFASTTEVGRQLGLDTSPAAALALAADGRNALLIIDQLDAVSLASGRMPQSFDVVMDLIGEALSVSGVRVVLACREFDVENDHRIRALAQGPDIGTVGVEELPIEAVKAAVEGMGLDPAPLTSKQLTILQTPLHLVLLSSLAGQDDALQFQSRGSLFESFWERKRQAAKERRPNVRFNEVLARIANAASDRQVLSVPVEVLDDGDLIEDANVLVSERVLVRDSDRIAFFHEAFFDYTFARQWVSRDESLVEFLLRDEQELFRRAQIRQILQHLRDRSGDRFRDEVEAVLTSGDVRFHIKEAALAVFSNVPQPTAEDSALVLRVAAAATPRAEARLWQQLRRAEWFQRIYEDGLVQQWLDTGDEALQTRALDLMRSGATDQAATVAALLATRSQQPEYRNWLRWVLPFGDLHRSRELFDLLLDAVRRGYFDDAEHELWLTVHALADHRPKWAIELLRARLIDRSNALALDASGKVASLATHEYEAAELVRKAADAEPKAFTGAVLPYLRAVMQATAREQHLDEPIRDEHFGMRLPDRDHFERGLDEVLFSATTQALAALALSSSEDVTPMLQELASDPYDASQFLLYRALIAGAAAFADWAAEILLQGAHRLDCGYVSDADWVARELVQAIAPYVDDDTHLKLEEALRDLRNPYEVRGRTGYAAFTFLSALREDRLTAEGRRRLGEYRRKFRAEQPSQHRGIEGGSVNSPITRESAGKMSDQQWLSAMTKYNRDEHDWHTFTGGARELSHVLKDCVVSEPQRFAKLALRVTEDMHSAYGGALLMGFGESEQQEDPSAIFDGIRHIVTLNCDDHDRWLGYALRRYYKVVPLDLVERILERAMNAPDPEDDTPVFTRADDKRQRARDLHQNGFNTSRGSLAESLGDLLVYDVDGVRTRLVVPHLKTLAADPILSVRSCVAHTIAASLRHARPDALEAFSLLIKAEDLLLAAPMVQQLMLYVGNVNPEVVVPVIGRMLRSEDVEAREVGGQLAAFAALEWDRPELMEQALAGDGPTRQGVASTCAGRLEHTSNSGLAGATLMKLFDDPDDEVRKEAAQVAARLRDRDLAAFARLLESLVDSPAYEHASPQLLITLRRATARVDDLVLRASQRFVSVHGEDAADIRTGAAGDARYISDLVVRGLAQSRDKQHRAALLDVLDVLLELGVYGIGEAIADFERL